MRRADRRPLTAPERMELARRGVLAQPDWCADAAGTLWIRSLGRRRRWVKVGTWMQRCVARVGLMRVWDADEGARRGG